jgi:hypothetical protein
MSRKSRYCCRAKADARSAVKPVDLHGKNGWCVCIRWSARGWRIAKDKTSHKIDIVVALAQAALAAVRKGQESWIRQGAIGPDGRITWRGEKQPLTRFRVVTITEQQDLKQRGLL